MKRFSWITPKKDPVPIIGGGTASTSKIGGGPTTTSTHYIKPAVTEAGGTKPLSSLDKSVQSMLNYKVNTPYGTGNPPSGRKKWITKIASGKDDLLLRAKIKDTHFKEFSKDSSLNDLITRIADMKKWGEDFNFGVRLEGENIRGRKGYWNSYPGYDQLIRDFSSLYNKIPEATTVGEKLKLINAIKFVKREVIGRAEGYQGGTPLRSKVVGAGRKKTTSAEEFFEGMKKKHGWRNDPETNRPFLSVDAVDEYNELKKIYGGKAADIIHDRGLKVYNVLEDYRLSHPESKGSEIRGALLKDILREDPSLDAWINRMKKEGVSSDSIDKQINDAVLSIRQHFPKNFQPNTLGHIPMPEDAQVLNFIKKFQKEGGAYKDFNFLKMLDAPVFKNQKTHLTALRKNINDTLNQNYSDIPLDSRRGARAFFIQEVNRMIRYGLGKEKLPLSNIMENVGKTSKKDIEKVIPLLLEKFEVQDAITTLNKMTKDTPNAKLIDQISLAHIKDVAADYKLALTFNNMYLAPRLENIKTFWTYNRRISDLLSDIRYAEKNKDFTQVDKLKKDLYSFGKELESKGIITEVGGQRFGKEFSPEKYKGMYGDEIRKILREQAGGEKSLSVLKEGGLVRPHMSLGGDMAQFTEMESVVPDLNPAEAGMEDYTQVAFSAISKFKNPFKKVDPPPIMSDVASGIKITDKTKKGVKVEGTIKTEGQTPVFHLKSDLEIANSPLDKMNAQQWNGYLLKNGVSPTEMHEFGLGNLLKNIGGFDEGTKKWKNNAPITKAELISQYKNNKPVISYKIQQMEPFQKGWIDFQNFLTGQRSGGSGYLGDMPAGAREFEEMRRLRNKPQDIIGDRLRTTTMNFARELSERTGKDIKGAWLELEPQITSNINKIIKEAYGIENVVENGFGNVKVPFYTQNLVNRFRRLKSGEGFYMGKTGVGHEGAQFLSGGTGYIEIPFTYNPNPKGMRANEPQFTFGEGHFTNPSGNNPVFWLRASERIDEQGKRVFLIEEIQSDMHQKVKQKPNTFSYAERMDAPGAVDANILSDRLKTLTVEIEKVSDQIDKITGHTDPSAVTVMERLKVKREALRLEIANTRKRMSVTHTDEVFPEGPWKKSENQAKIAIKTLINLATQEGFDSVAMISAKAKNHAVGASADIAKGNRGFYDNIAVSGMKNVAKNLDLEFSSTNIKDGNGNTWAKIPIINLKKEPVKASVDMYKSEGGFIYRPSFVDVVPVL